MGLLFGFPRVRLSGASYVTGDLLAKWIEQHIPCFVGNVPIEYTEALLDLFVKESVPDKTIREAFLILEAKGVRFDFPMNYQLTPPVLPRANSSLPPPPQLKGVSQGEWRQLERSGVEEYERKYVLAIKTNNAPGAEAALAAVLQLLWGIAKGYGKTRQAARHEKVAEWEEFNQAVDEAMDRARTLRSHIRQLTREEIKSLRDAPTPTALRNVTVRIASRVTVRNIPSARRVRR